MSVLPIYPFSRVTTTFLLLAVDCCSCTEDPSCSLCDLGHGFCSYSDKDEVKETTCPGKCENKILSYMSPAGSTANKCDKDSGWACDYTVTAVECCGDPDCAGLTCVAEGYGLRVKKCDTTGAHGAGTQWTCQCDPCTSTSQCASGYCCVDDTSAPSPRDGTGKCLGPDSPPYKYSSQWLCA